MSTASKEDGNFALINVTQNFPMVEKGTYHKHRQFLKTKKTLGDRAFQVASPGLWNGLPNDIRNAKTMDVFKSLVKTHLFRKAYACYF